LESTNESLEKPLINLFEPFNIGRLGLKNRFVRSATWDNTADDSGAVTEKSVAIYSKLSQGGIGLIVTGFAFIAPSGKALPRQYGIHNDAMISGLHRLVRVTHGGGSKIALQIVHAGMNSPYLFNKGMMTMAVSEQKHGLRPGIFPLISRKQKIKVPHREITDEEIESIISGFASAAVRAQEAGFDAVQLHGAHGYLMSQFLSPLFNVRTDRWGGTAENRRRFHLEVIQKVRKAIGDDFPLMIKFGVQDDEEGGLSLNEGLETAKLMVAKGIDAIEISGGIGVPSIKRKTEQEKVPYRDRAAAVKRVVTVPVIVVQGIRSLDMAKNIVESGDADLISMSRPFIQEPGLIARWQRGETWSSQCISCHRCHSENDEPVQCRRRGNRQASSLHL
jgi:2,4-dienoyl-CoA reductase-like NADH-dependent reductase (Old Yellow Enzyme family)